MAQFGLSAEDALTISKKYTEKTIMGEGAIKGKDGADGKDGKDGKSAYQTALDTGFIGTESEWLESLKGEKGEQGDNGKSAYQIWLDAGNTGTEQDFLDSLKGEGTDGFSPVITENSNNTDEDYRLDIETKESKFTTPNLKADIRKNIAEHNTSPDSHNDIRIFLNELNNRLNALANSDDETLDEMKEVVAYIKDNRSLIESITTTKVNVADIIDNLTTNVSNKPLSASQGVVIKNLIDTFQSELTAHANNAGIHVTASEKTSWNNKVTRIKLTGQLQRNSHRRSVIALCEVTPTNTNATTCSYGKLIFHRDNGLYGTSIMVDIKIHGGYSGENELNVSILEHGNGLVSIKPCTFDYEGKTYGGVEVCISVAESSDVVFEGYTNFKIFGLDYYNYNEGSTQPILNEEVYNSLNFETNINYNSRLFYNKNKVYTEANKPTPSEIGASKAVHTHEIADVNGLQTIADNNQVLLFTPNQTGWYRIAEYNSNNRGQAAGSFGNSCEIIVKKSYTNTPTEEHRILLKSKTAFQKFISISANSDDNYHAYTKIRYVYTDTKAYIDIYYTSNNSNNGSLISIKDGKDFAFKWETITPTLVEETVEGETVSTVFDIPENANPVTDLDLTIDAIQGLRAELDELRSLITNS